MGEGNIFALCVSPHFDAGGGRGGEGIPIPGQSGGGGFTPISGQGWGYPISGRGVLDWAPPPIKTGWGYPHPVERQSIYAVGGMPLAFTQEDFLVSNTIVVQSVRVKGGMFHSDLFYYIST